MKLCFEFCRILHLKKHFLQEYERNPDERIYDTRLIPHIPAHTPKHTTLINTLHTFLSRLFCKFQIKYSYLKLSRLAIFRNLPAKLKPAIIKLVILISYNKSKQSLHENITFISISRNNTATTISLSKKYVNNNHVFSF